VRVLSLLPVVAGLGFAFNDSAAPLFMGLRVLPGGIVYCIAKGIFADGLTLVGYATNPSGNTEGGIPTLPYWVPN